MGMEQHTVRTSGDYIYRTVASRPGPDVDPPRWLDEFERGARRVQAPHAAIVFWASPKNECAEPETTRAGRIGLTGW